MQYKVNSTEFSTEILTLKGDELRSLTPVDRGGVGNQGDMIRNLT